MSKRNYRNSYPGEGYYYIICDVCGKKMRARDGILIKDRYNFFNGLVVCREDADETNPQTYIKAIREKQIDNPKMIRSEQPDRFAFISDADEIETGDLTDPTGRTASAPKHLTIIGASSSFVELQWLGPEDPGSGTTKYYRIERESPTGGGFSVLVDMVGSVALYYKDASVVAATQYNYRVRMINGTGTSEPSNEAEITTSS